MDKLGQITFVSLDGTPPAELRLDDLPPASSMRRLVASIFGPYLGDGARIVDWIGGGIVSSPDEGLHLIYVYGHAWIGHDGPQVAWTQAGQTRLGSAQELLGQLITDGTAGRTVLVMDCCHAAAFDARIDAKAIPRLAVYACGADEGAIALHEEEATRLGLELASQLRRARDPLDLIQVIAHVADRLCHDGVIAGQAVTYRAHGQAIRLSRGRGSGSVSRETTVARIRARLLIAGALVAAGLGGGIWFYRQHVFIEVDLQGLQQIGANARLTVYEDEPSGNVHRVASDHVICDAPRIRIWVPASNLIIQVQADYLDKAERALNTHVVLSPGLNWANKRVSVTLPPLEEIRSHPDMAFVPATPWIHGRDREPRRNEQSYWIDLRPPTVVQYEPIARRLLAEGKLAMDNSFLLSWRQRSGAIDAVGLLQLRPLVRSLGDIASVIAAANSDVVVEPGDIVTGTGELPCDSCPAPMTRHEATLFCAHRGMRLPTDLQWELAVRGVDGRDFPWGNRFDPARANVPGLPDKGDPPQRLKPVDAYPTARSPFGLFDTVGNAGDWVTNESGSYDRVYMGATYRFNPEDATAFRMLPQTDSYAMLAREITARCVSSSDQSRSR